MCDVISVRHFTLPDHVLIKCLDMWMKHTRDAPRLSGRRPAPGRTRARWPGGAPCAMGLTTHLVLPARHIPCSLAHISTASSPLSTTALDPTTLSLASSALVAIASRLACAPWASVSQGEARRVDKIEAGDDDVRG